MGLVDGDATMKLGNPKQLTDETAVRDLIEAIAQAVRVKDVDAMLPLCAPDIVVFDLVPPLVHKGASEIRRAWELGVGAFEGPVQNDIHDLEVEVDGSVAWARCLSRFGGTMPGGQRVMNSLRLTLAFRKDGQTWRMVHQHVSVPFDMESGTALLDLAQ
jgi:uncharacterized protein (TIGR02246 family)